MIKKINRIHYEGTNGSFLTINQFGASFGTIEQIKRATRINLYNKDFAKFESNDYKEMMLSFAGGFDKLKFLVDGYDTKRIYQILNGNLIESKELRLNDWDYSIWSYCANENSIICSSRVEGIRRYSLVDLGSKTIKESVSCSINLIDDFLFHYSNLSILCFDPTTMIEVWSKDYTIDLDHIEGMNRVMAPIIGVHSDVFVFSYQGDWLVGVDVHTGNVLWKVKYPDNFRGICLNSISNGQEIRGFLNQ